MELEQFSLLESKIHRLVEIVQSLRTENKALKSNISDLHGTISKQEKQILDLENQLAEENERPGEGHSAKEREELIRAKIEQILAKLESLEIEL